MVFRVEFPADLAARRDRDQLHRVRGAIELFDRLAAVNNAFFRILFCDITYCVADELAGVLSSQDLIATKSFMAWDELFGCPEDPWDLFPVHARLQHLGS
ncbi:hypothetical protein PHMEG_0004889 [Phytophthora megakarya]|uniref:Uncharacterized protein n=1 Tax=Phytophthora megakarya TaxID=4795 RepID=A0A225WST2_9STRA|nr:hypothetical protein PHMEG_0004889 [Phytophthora megakarya]